MKQKLCEFIVVSFK